MTGQVVPSSKNHMALVRYGIQRMKAEIDPDIREPVEAIRTILEVITGKNPKLSPLEPLDSTATLGDLINAYNRLLDRLQWGG